MSISRAPARAVASVARAVWGSQGAEPGPGLSCIGEAPSVPVGRAKLGQGGQAGLCRAEGKSLFSGPCGKRAKNWEVFGCR